MTVDAGNRDGEAREDVTVEQIIDAALDGLDDAERIEVDIDQEARKRTVHTAANALARVLREILRNASDAAPGPSATRVEAGARDGILFIVVRDRGDGMTPEQIARAAEPFYTTKEPGAGMGLGLFLASEVLARLGGLLEIESAPGNGTAVRLTLPVGVETGPELARAS